MDIAITGAMLLVIAGVLTVLVIGLILLFKFFMKKRGAEATAKYQDHKWSSPLEGRTKYPDLDVFSCSDPFSDWDWHSAS